MKKIYYDYTKSVRENAELNGCTAGTIYKYIQRNKIDRYGDEQRKMFLMIDKACKSPKVLSRVNANDGKKHSLISEVAKELGLSYGTVKRYMAPNYDSRAQFTKGKKAHFDNGNSDALIHSVYGDQNDILMAILSLHVHDCTFSADFTYSIGNFYKKIAIPEYRYDKFPQEGLKVSVEQLDSAYNLPCNSLHSVMVDLPFMVKEGDNTPRNKETSIIAKRFTAFSSMEDMYAANREMMNLAWDKLEDGGYLVMKTQDNNSAGRQLWTHCVIEEHARHLGYEFIDLFILTAKSRTTPGRLYVQRHARKYHSYFYVFRKPKKKATHACRITKSNEMKDAA